MQNRYPEHEANIFGRLVFQWVQPILTTGYQRPLEKHDTFLPTPSLSAEKQADDLSAAWDKQLRKPKPSLLRAINSVYGKVFWPAGFVKLIGDIVNVVSPLLLEAMTRFVTHSHAAKVSGRPLPSAWNGYAFAIALFLLQILGSVTQHIYFHAVTKVGVQLKTALITNVYRKSLVLSPKARQEFTNGKIVNLMSTDTSRLDMVSSLFHGLWCNPVRIVITGILLINNIGISALAGLALLILIGPTQAYAMNQLLKIRKKAAEFTDKRVRLTQEMLNGIRIIKFFTWETSFLETLMKIRAFEFKYARKLLMIRVAVINVSMTMPVLASTISILVYASLGNKLDAATIFSAIALFNAIRVPLILLPTVLSMTADGMVSLKRLEQLMLAEELEPMPEADANLKYALDMRNADFKWESTIKSTKEELKAAPPASNKLRLSYSRRKERKSFSKEKSTGSSLDVVEKHGEKELEIPYSLSLQNITLKVPRGSLVAVVGQVGSGKSCLLNALIGEMKRERGTLKFGGSIAYCSQTPWIQNTTVRENIIFGSDYDESRYSRVISSCALEHDLEILQDGDETEIGERGITLSGGQKQRLNIARAVYSRSDIVLLDDPLSAVDAHVGRHIFEKCILQEMSNRTRILVTHQLQYLPRVDKIVVMDNGRIAQQGRYIDLINQPGIFKNIIEEYGGVEATKNDLQIDIETLKVANGEILSKIELNHSKTEEITEVVKPAVQENIESQHHDLMTKEERAIGAVKWSVYRSYFAAAGGLFSVGFLLLIVILTQLARASTDLWLSSWSGNVFHFSSGLNMGIYAMWGIVQVFFNNFEGLYFAVLALAASNRLHKNAVFSVFRAPVAFFDTTPLGRIINRFSKDIDSTDFQLSDSFRMFLDTLATIVSIFSFICVIFPWFLLPLIPLTVVFYFFQVYYRCTSRELKRLDSITRSPLFAHFSESLAGLATIRAYGAQAAFKRRNQELADDNNKAYFLSVSIQRWLGVRSETIVSVLTFCVMIFAVNYRTSVSPGLVGLIISYMLQVSGMFTWAVRQFAEVENNMNAVERLSHYVDHLDHEAPAELPAAKPSNRWPDQGAISVRDLEMRYRPDLPLVLRGVSFEIQGGEKVGIVGRTGSGKSSILMALFRMVESSAGSILIDGKDISRLGLNDLRSRLAIIPQDPSLFTGTFRTNLDPFNLHTDYELWEALKRADMHEYVNKHHEGLDAEISEGGENLSAGQRQLVCLARAILVNAKILVMDEATASVDPHTDALLQKAIRMDFAGCTILTIAHRLNTVIDYDKILVLEDGYVREFGSPQELLENKEGVFSSMMKEGS